MMTKINTYNYGLVEIDHINSRVWFARNDTQYDIDEYGRFIDKYGAEWCVVRNKLFVRSWVLVEEMSGDGS